jgi:hypothetical protein
MNKQQITKALHTFINQRTGMDWRNYSDAKAYRAELRSVIKDGQQARALLRYVELSTISGDDLAAAFPRAFAGRLSWNGERLDYCTGQYFPTEYRRAVCAVLASSIWHHWRDDDKTGDAIRAAAKSTFGRTIANRWFA